LVPAHRGAARHDSLSKHLVGDAGTQSAQEVGGVPNWLARFD
jgi:hypothetical protein